MLHSLLETAGEEQFWWVGSKIGVIPIQCDELADAKSGVGKQRDDRLVSRLKIVREGVGEAGIPDSFDLFGREPGGGLFLSMSA